MKYKKNQNKFQKGFSLVELIVVVSIFIIISTVTLFKQSKFSSDILITNTAYEVALAIREAQVFGSGSKQGGDAASNRSKSYGVFFNDEEKSFLMYAESPTLNDDAKVYDSVFDPLDEDKYSVVDTITLNRDQKINDICGIDLNDEDQFKCLVEGEIEELNIAFIKPNLNPVIKGKSGADVTTFDGARIIVQSDLGDKCRTIFINNAGQVSVIAVEPGESGCN